MGIIFLDDPDNPDQHPDYKPIPSPASEAMVPVGVTALAALVGVFPLCPAVHDGHVHPHHEIYPGSELPAWAYMASGQNSTSGVPGGWMNGNVVDAGRDVVRFRRTDGVSVLGSETVESGTAPPAVDAIFAGMQRYDKIPVPILAIYAAPHRLPESASAEDREDKMTFAQASAFEKGLPSARVVRLPNAGHVIWRTNEADVLREMHAFMAGLK